MKFLLKIPHFIVELFKLIPTKLRWAVNCILFASGFYFAVIRSGTWAADFHGGETVDIVVGIIMMLVALDVFIYAGTEEKDIEVDEHKYLNL